MPPQASHRTITDRRPSAWIAVCAVVPGLVLGFAAGVELARTGHALPTHGPASPRAAISHLEAPPAPARPAVAIGEQAGPSRSSVQAQIEATDPAAWLSRFGEVHSASLDGPP